MTKDDALIAIIDAQRLFVDAICTHQKLASIVGKDEDRLVEAVENACNVFFDRARTAIEAIDD